MSASKPIAVTIREKPITAVWWWLIDRAESLIPERGRQVARELKAKAMADREQVRLEKARQR